MADKNYQQNVEDAGELGLLMERLDLLSNQVLRWCKVPPLAVPSV